MIAVVVLVIAVLVVVAIVWVRVATARSESKSVETYEHALDVLGEVAKRTESTGFRMLPHEEAGRPHVGRSVDETGLETPLTREGTSPPSEQNPLSSSPLPPAGAPKFRVSDPYPLREPPRRISTRLPVEPPHFDEQLGEEPEAVPEPERHVVPGFGVRTRAVSATYRHRQVMGRRVATGLTAVVAVVALVVGGLYLAGSGKHHSAGATTTTSVRSNGGKTKNSTTTTTAPTTLKPTTGSSEVVFTVPWSKYTVIFKATGAECWVGVRQSANGAWLVAQTVAAGQSVTYSGSGTTVITLGAPAHISITVNGRVAELPSNVTVAYTVYLEPSAT
jgi:uncharacterized membrane protein